MYALTIVAARRTVAVVHGRSLRLVKILAPVPYVPAGYAPVLMAQSLGYGAEEGLDLQVVAGGSPRQSIHGAIAGDGVGFVNMVFNFLVRDEGHPFRSFFSIARKQNRSFAVPAESTIRRLSDLKGKVIGLHFPDLLDFAHAALAGEGVDPQRDVRFVPLPGSPLDEDRMVASVRKGEVHAIWQIDLNYGLFATAGLPLRRLPAPVIDRLTPAACLYARDDLIASHPETYAAIGRAVAKGTLFAMTNPEATVKLLWRDVPQARPRANEAKRIMRRDLAVLNDRLALSRIEDASDPRWGAITLREVEIWQDFMLATKAIKTPRDPHEYFTSEFVSHYNDFDGPAVINQAREFQLGSRGKLPNAAEER
jgi:NitT/TauT family transport system substrate-binding protein